MDKPLIGITLEIEHDEKDARTGGRLQCNRNYTEEITRAGGVPVLIPPSADMSVIAQLIDGWLIPGGDDLDASHFGQENHPHVDLGDPDRFLSEKKLFAEVSRDMPILGICYGCQCLNVLQGGTLHQHLPDMHDHNEHASGRLEEYAIVGGSKLAAMAGATARGKSFHHQAADEVAPTMSVVARANDGTVEALEATDRAWTVGVQWHPERTPEDSATRGIFDGFIAAARAYKAAK